jgi:hypothetical protein
MSKPKVKWSNKGEKEDFDAAHKYLSLLTLDARARAGSCRRYAWLAHDPPPARTARRQSLGKRDLCDRARAFRLARTGPLSPRPQ